jgi:antirestriction protein
MGPGLAVPAITPALKVINMVQTNNFTHSALGANITDQAAIYCGTYAKYNNGSIAGAWIDLTQVSDADELYEICAAIHSNEADPEYMFQDYQGFPRAFYGESGLDSKIWGYLQKIADGTDADALRSFVENDSSADLSSFEDSYCGKYKDMEDYAYELIRECYVLPEPLASYFDYEKYARDLGYDGYWQDSNGHVFRPY